MLAPDSRFGSAKLGKGCVSPRTRHEQHACRARKPCDLPASMLITLSRIFSTL